MTDSKQKLDNMTVRRFAKLLKKNNKANSAPTLISGTVTKNDGETLISTENGDVSASLASANLNVGDSVMALCSNDEAVVIGNVTDKSACASELASTKDEVVSRIEKTEKKAGESLTVATEAKQTATEFSTTATSAKKTAEEALTQSSNAVQAADKIQTTLTSDYSKTGEDATYATQTQLTQTSSDLTLKITNAETDAKKVATNYLNFSSSGGLVVGDMTASTLGGNTQITSTGVNVRKGTTTLGSFTGDTITLGKTASGNNNTYIDTNGIQLRNGTTALASFNTTKPFIGDISNNKNVSLGFLKMADGTFPLSISVRDCVYYDDEYVGIITAPTGLILNATNSDRAASISLGSIETDLTVYPDECLPNLQLHGAGAMLYLGTDSTAGNKGKSSAYFSANKVYIDERPISTTREKELFNAKTTTWSSSLADTITLNSSCASFRYLDVWGVNNDSKQCFTRVYSPTVDTCFLLRSATAHDDVMWVKANEFKITKTTTISLVSGGGGEFNTNTKIFTTGTYTKIIRVVGIDIND